MLNGISQKNGRLLKAARECKKKKDKKRAVVMVMARRTTHFNIDEQACLYILNTDRTCVVPVGRGAETFRDREARMDIVCNQTTGVNFA